MRKMISFKIENFPDKQRKIIDDWANNQSNIQQSLLNVVMHIVSVAGNDDVMDFDVQRKLHLLFGQSGAGQAQQPVQLINNSNPQPVQNVDNVPADVVIENTGVEDVYKKATWFNDEE